MAFKQKVVAYAEGESNSGAARRFGVDEKRVREWRKLKADIVEREPPKKPLKGGGKKTVLGVHKEKQLVNWIESIRSQNLHVTRGSIQLKVREIHDDNGEDDNFDSRGLLEGFFKLHMFFMSRTTVSQCLPKHVAPKVVLFVMNIHRHMQRSNYPFSCVGNMDETPLWMDMPGNTTVERQGMKYVPVRTTDHENVRFTVLAAMANGIKLKPFIVLKGVWLVAELLASLVLLSL